MKTPWFEVDKKGLAKTVERRGKAFVFYELLQNSSAIDGTYACNNGRDCSLRLRRKLRNR